MTNISLYILIKQKSIRDEDENIRNKDENIRDKERNTFAKNEKKDRNIEKTK